MVLGRHFDRMAGAKAGIAMQPMTGGKAWRVC